MVSILMAFMFTMILLLSFHFDYLPGRTSRRRSLPNTPAAVTDGHAHHSLPTDIPSPRPACSPHGPERPRSRRVRRARRGPLAATCYGSKPDVHIHRWQFIPVVHE
jgi:hypothetical protein